MSISRAWDWSIGSQEARWLEPSEECYYLAERWSKAWYKRLLDFGSGLGRHSVFFAKKGFDVSSFDLSAEGIAHLNNWAEREGLTIDTSVADMTEIPYDDNSFDCLFAYHVIFHTDTPGMKRIMGEIKRVVRPGGEIYVTFLPKHGVRFNDPRYPKIDENTILEIEDGPEKDVPHFCVDLQDIRKLTDDFGMELLKVRNIEDYCLDNTNTGALRNGWHYFVLAGRRF